ncbi:MAG: glycosyltransferase family 2 protein, partial [Halothece sp. Uz-M2-17]|nr:glycosyltransferase family 2 protein [Halothece sp. Uz-M2-17]
MSIIVPIHNEVQNLSRLLELIASSLQNADRSYEIICIDDGSTDGSTDLLGQEALIRDDLQAIILRRNYGQTAAMAAGFNYAQGDIIVTLDGDLQNDPADIPNLLAKLEEGYDLVSGWRKHRQDAALTRLLPSKIANWLIGRVTGVRLHDYGCSLKAYRSELVKDIHLYGELHRFLPALAFIEGAKIVEIPVQHHRRYSGRSKYGLMRTFRVLMDLITILFMKTFLTKPMHAFGSLGFLSIFLGVALSLYLVYLRFIAQQAIGNRPLLLLAAVLFLAGLQMLCFGLLAELVTRTYHESQKRP